MAAIGAEWRPTAPPRGNARPNPGRNCPGPRSGAGPNNGSHTARICCSNGVRGDKSSRGLPGRGFAARGGICGQPSRWAGRVIPPACQWWPEHVGRQTGAQAGAQGIRVGRLPGRATTYPARLWRPGTSSRKSTAAAFTAGDSINTASISESSTPEPPNLHLGINASKELQLAIPVQARQVSGPIETAPLVRPRTPNKRISHASAPGARHTPEPGQGLRCKARPRSAGTGRSWSSTTITE